MCIVDWKPNQRVMVTCTARLLHTIVLKRFTVHSTESAASMPQVNPANHIHQDSHMRNTDLGNVTMVSNWQCIHYQTRAAQTCSR